MDLPAPDHVGHVLETCAFLVEGIPQRERFIGRGNPLVGCPIADPRGSAAMEVRNGDAILGVVLPGYRPHACTMRVVSTGRKRLPAAPVGSSFLNRTRIGLPFPFMPIRLGRVIRSADDRRSQILADILNPGIRGIFLPVSSQRGRRQVRVQLQAVLRGADHIIVRIGIGCLVRNGQRDVLAKIVLITCPCAQRVTQTYILPHRYRAGC